MSKGAKLALALSVLASFPFLVMLRGYMLSSLWEWFVVPLDVRPIGVVHAIGFSILVGIFTGLKKNKESPDDLDAAVTELVTNVAALVLVFGFGWVVHLFM